MRKALFASLVLASVLGGSQAYALSVKAAASNGDALAGNNANANILVVVTNLATGAAITTLTKTDFTVIDHFALPGQLCGFSNNVTTFNNVGTGAYQLQVQTHSTTPPPGGCKWVKGDYLGQVIVKAPGEAGQAPFTLSIP
jgi:hypothetical protein